MTSTQVHHTQSVRRQPQVYTDTRIYHVRWSGCSILHHTHCLESISTDFGLLRLMVQNKVAVLIAMNRSASHHRTIPCMTPVAWVTLTDIWSGTEQLCQLTVTQCRHSLSVTTRRQCKSNTVAEVTPLYYPALQSNHFD